MTKYCGNCGAQMNENARVCGVCGTPFPVAGMTNVPSSKPDVTTSRMKLKKVLIIVVAFLVLIVAGVIGFKVVKDHSGYNPIVKTIIKAYKEDSVEGLLDCKSDAYEDNQAPRELFTENMDYMISSFENTIGHEYRISYKVVEEYELSQRKLDELIDELESYNQRYDGDRVESAAVVEIRITAKHRRKSHSEKVVATMIKEDESWKLLSLMLE